METKTYPVLSIGVATTTINEMTATAGAYRVTGSCSKRGDGTFEQLNVSVAWEPMGSANMSRYGENSQVNISMPESLIDELSTEVMAILKNYFNEIKTK